MVAFNEVQFGYVPHAGSTFFLSRLPDDFGTFLSLTGMPISGKDAIKLKVADNFIYSTYEHESVINDVVYARDPSSLSSAAQTRMQDHLALHFKNRVNDYSKNVAA